jgi:hypothetical protein
MGKTRKSIPKQIKEKVLKEYNYRCAICGTDKPQLHHIDGNHDNNDELNLMPLCPNCHLTDQHDPTKPTEPQKLQLFRRYKDPNILNPKFHPIFLKLDFLFEVTDDSDSIELDKKAEDLVEFLKEFKKGSYYAKKVSELIRIRFSPNITVIGDRRSEQLSKETHNKDLKNYLEQLHEVKEEVFSLVIEALRYQDW